MSNKNTPTNAQAREDRLKAALKANMGRRKAQARARQQAIGPKQADDQVADKKE